MQHPVGRNRRLTAAGLVAVLAIVGALAWAGYARQAARPPLLEGLSGPWQAASAEFDRRLQARFPAGSPALGMAAELHAAGFEQQDWIEPGALHVAVWQRREFPCTLRARVTWRADAEGRLLELHGSYGEAGCL